MSNEAHYDEEVKAAILVNAPDTRIQQLFEQFHPSYTLDYVGPARLGLAAYICARRPDLLATVFQVVAQDYFQLGVVTDSDFKKVLEWAVRDRRNIITRHGDSDAPEWLHQNFERYHGAVGQRLAELVEEFRRENENA